RAGSRPGISPVRNAHVARQPLSKALLLLLLALSPASTRALHALASEDSFTVQGAAAREEWVRRPFVRRAVGKALRNAQTKTTLADVAHLARLALLTAAKRDANLNPADIDDPRTVDAAFRDLPKPIAKSLPWITLATLACLACAIALGALTKGLLRP